MQIIELLIKVKIRLYYRMEEMMKIARIQRSKANENGDSLNQIIYIKYKEEKNMKKALLLMKVQEKVAQKTTIEERRIFIIEGVSEEHIYERLKNIERTRERKETIKPELSYMKEVWKKILAKTKNDLASRVLLNKEFTKEKHTSFETVELHSTAIGGQSQVGNLWTIQEKSILSILSVSLVSVIEKKIFLTILIKRT